MEIDQSLALKSDRLYDKAILYSATGLFALTIVLTTIQVFVRWLNLPTFGFLHWTEPAARFILIIATYLGAAVALRNGEHIAIRFLLERIRERSPTMGTIVDVFVNLVVIGFLAIVLRGLIERAHGDWATSIGGVGAITSGNLYLGIAIGIGLMLLYALADLAVVMYGYVRSSDNGGENGNVNGGVADE